MTDITTESRISVLHVDTDPSVADRLDRADPRLSVRTATAAADALATLDDAPSPPVDCLVSEYDLPGTDGLGLLDAVRERRPDLPVVLYTDAGDEGIASDAIAAGVTDYVPKRRGPDRLADRLRDAVEGAGPDRAAPDRDAQYRRLFEDAPVMYVVFRDVNGEPVVADCNDRFLDRLGYDPDAVFGRSIWDLYAQSSMPDAVEGFDRGREGTFGHQERTLIAADGNHVETLFRASPRVNADGEVIGTLGLYVDITENKRRERTLERLHDVTRSLVRAADRTEVAETVVDAVRDVLGYPRNLVRLVDDDGAELPPVAITDEAAATLGERPHYAVGEGTAGRAFADDETLVYDDVRTVDDGYDRSGVRAAMFVPIGDHGVLSVGSTEAGAFDAADVHLAEVFAANAGTALTLLDRTRELERQNERLTDFASVVSHDLRTPLSVVDGSLELARERYGDDADLARAARSLDRGFDLIEELLTLARGADTLSPEPLSLRSAAAACWESLATDDDETLVADDATIRADEAAFRRLLENLLGNCVAHGATDAGVTVTVGLLADDRGLYVADDGPGIDDDVGDDVFEVGFTTDDGGTGLGLAIVERIAQEHGWTVGLGEADGARFEIEGVDVVSA
ncbi:ATP-binding protein [Haloplanus salinarum]|uniref:receiver/sensor box histidine kinase n=1 Tax=Haloplanus salinarum TaxID=1912324 RepID=UPI00214BD011|nr:ATP-binding protein [Haloplanus salinarum]